MSLVATIMAVWGGLLVLGVLAGSALGLVARVTDDANDLELARGLERQYAAMARVRERNAEGESVRRSPHRPGPTVADGEIPAGLHSARGR